MTDDPTAPAGPGPVPGAGGGDPVSGADLMAAIAALAAELGDVRRHLGEVDTGMAKLGGQVHGLAGLAGEVAKLAGAVAAINDSDEETGPPRPLDWNHIPAEDRHDVLEALAEWVREVLLIGWPSVRRQLRTCWPRHIEIINGLLWLRCSWETAYAHASGRAHHAAEFHRTLNDVAERADRLTRECPRPGETRQPHTVPLPTRSDQAALLQGHRDQAMAQIRALGLRAAQATTTPEDRAALTTRAREIWNTWQITTDEYQLFERAAKTTEDTEREAAHTSQSDQTPPA